MRYNRHQRHTSAQSILEFAAAMVILCLILYGMVAIFRWGMMDMAERRYDHDTVLTDQSGWGFQPQQVNPNFHQIRTMDTVIYRNTGH